MKSYVDGRERYEEGSFEEDAAASEAAKWPVALGEGKKIVVVANALMVRHRSILHLSSGGEVN